MRNQKNPERKIQGENPKVTSYGKRGFTTKEASSNLPISSVNGKKKKELLHTFFVIQGHSGINHLWPSIDLRNKKNVIVIFQSVIKVKELEGKYSFRNNIIFLRLYPQYIFNFNKYFVHIIFLFCFANLVGPKFKQFVRTVGFGKNKIICYNKS